MNGLQKNIMTTPKRSENNIRICHIASGDLWAGAEVQLVTVLDQLNNYDFIDISVIVLNQGTLAERLLALGIPVFVIDEKKNSLIQIWFKSFRILKIVQPHILHSHRYKENLLSALLGIVLHKTKKVRTQHTTFITLNSSDGIKMRFYRNLDIITAKMFTDKVIAVSKHISRQVSICIGKDRVVAIHNFVDPQKVLSESNYKEPKNWNDEGFFLIGTAGRLVEVKGYDYFIKAAKLVCNECGNIKFIIVGSGHLYSTLKRQIAAAGISDRVILTGFRNDTKNILRSLNVFVMSSLYEGIPMALLEALALGKPVIATNVGGIPEVIKNGYNGILIESRNEKMIYEKCLYLYRNKKVRETLSVNGMKSVKEKFNSRDKIDQLYSVYRDIGTLS